MASRRGGRSVQLSRKSPIKTKKGSRGKHNVPRSLGGTQSSHPFLEDSSGGILRRGGGGSSGANASLLSQEQARQIEQRRATEKAARDKAKLELQAKEEAILKQAKRTEKIRLEVIQRKQAEDQLREMTAQQKKAFFRQQADAKRIQSISNLAQKGGNLTPSARLSLDKARVNFSNRVREVQSNLVKGDTLILDRNRFEIKGIQSISLNQTIPFNERGVKFYNERVSQIAKKVVPAVSKTKEVLDKIDTLTEGVAAKIQGKTPEEIRAMWDKRKSTKEKVRLIEEERRRVARDTGIIQLVKEGELPLAVITLFDLAGEKLMSAGDLIRIKAGLGKEGRLTEAETRKGGQIIGETLLLAGFSGATATTAETLARLPTNTVVKFIGTQKTKGNKVVTDVAFVSSGKRVGTAKGVTIGTDKKGITLVIGRQIKGKNLQSLRNIDLAKKGKKFSSIEKSLTKKEIESGLKEIGIAPKTMKQLLRQNKISEIRRLLRRQLDKIIKELKSFKGATRMRKINRGTRFRINSLKLRKEKIENLLTRISGGVKKRISKQLREFKGTKTATKVKRGVNLIRGDISLRQKALQKQLSKFTKELKSFKGATRTKKITAELRFRKGDLIIRKQRLQTQLSKLGKELKSFKGIQRARLIKGEILIRQKKLQTQLSKLSKELKSFKGFSRFRKIKEEVRFRKASLGIRGSRLKGRVGRGLRSFKGVKRFKKIFPPKIRIIVTKNLKKIGQISKGQMKVGNKKRDVQDIFSSSDIFTRDDLIKILGRTVTRKKDVIEFTGYLKNLDKVGASGFSPVTAQQKVVYKKALDKVLSVVGSQTSAKSLGVSPRVSTSLRSATVKATRLVPPSVISPTLTKTISSQLKIPVPTVSGIKTVGAARNSLKSLDKSITKVKSSTSQLSNTKTKQKELLKQKEKLKQKLNQKVKQLQKQKARVALRLRLLLKLETGTPTGKITFPPPTKPKPPIIPLRIPKGFSRKTLSKAQEGYYVKIKRRGRVKNLTPRPLTLNDAKDFLAYRVDNGLSRSAWFEPIGKTKDMVQLPKAIAGYFGKASRKLRPFKIKSGKKKQIKFGYIEKKRFVGDTKREIRQLQKSRVKAARRKPIRRTTSKRIIVKRGVRKSPTRKINPTRRKQMLKNLEKARRTRSRNLKI